MPKEIIMPTTAISRIIATGALAGIVTIAGAGAAFADSGKGGRGGRDGRPSSSSTTVASTTASTDTTTATTAASATGKPKGQRPATTDQTASTQPRGEKPAAAQAAICERANAHLVKLATVAERLDGVLTELAVAVLEAEAAGDAELAADLGKKITKVEAKMVRLDEKVAKLTERIASACATTTDTTAAP